MVLDSIIATLNANINVDGFTLKLASFGKVLVKHKKGRVRKLPLTGEARMTANKRKVRFYPLSQLRELERVP